eukprot:5989383-Amphidinium_carterae.1
MISPRCLVSCNHLRTRGMCCVRPPSVLHAKTAQRALYPEDPRLKIYTWSAIFNHLAINHTCKAALRDAN